MRVRRLAFFSRRGTNWEEGQTGSQGWWGQKKRKNETGMEVASPVSREQTCVFVVAPVWRRERKVKGNDPQWKKGLKITKIKSRDKRAWVSRAFKQLQKICLTPFTQEHQRFHTWEVLTQYPNWNSPCSIKQLKDPLRLYLKRFSTASSEIFKINAYRKNKQMFFIIW